MIDRIERLYALRVHERLSDFPDELRRRHARRLAARPPSAGALIQEPARSIETACFLRYCLLLATDRLLMMIRRQVADLWRRAAAGAVSAQADWAALYQQLLAELGAIVAQPHVSEEQLRERLLTLLAAHRARRPASRAQLIRERLIDGVRPVRSLRSALVRLLAVESLAWISLWVILALRKRDMFLAAFSLINWQAITLAALLGAFRRIGDPCEPIRANELTSKAGRTHE